MVNKEDVLVFYLTKLKITDFSNEIGNNLGKQRWDVFGTLFKVMIPSPKELTQLAGKAP